MGDGEEKGSGVLGRGVEVGHRAQACWGEVELTNHAHWHCLLAESISIHSLKSLPKQKFRILLEKASSNRFLNQFTKLINFRSWSFSSPHFSNPRKSFLVIIVPKSHHARIIIFAGRNPNHTVVCSCYRPEARVNYAGCKFFILTLLKNIFHTQRNLFHF
jgi:hypothetical protein